MSQAFKRWYDHDPKLLEVIELLRNYQDELLVQAEMFLQKLEEQVSKEAIDRFYELAKPVNGCRWYDKNPELSTAIKTISTLPETDYLNIMEGICMSLKE